MSPAALELLQRLHAAVAQARLVAAPGAVAVVAGVEVVDHQRVDRIERQPLQRLLVGAHDAVIGVVEMHLEIEAADPGGAVEAGGILGPVERAADLGGDPELVARPGAEKAAEPVLGEAAAVPGGGVVVADAGVPGGLERGARIGLVDPGIELAEMGGAEAEGAAAPRLVVPTGVVASSVHGHVDASPVSSRRVLADAVLPSWRKLVRQKLV